MDVQTLPIGELKAALYNPRRPLRRGSPGYERLARSLAEFELVQPIVWNRTTGHIVAGHQRVEVLRHEGVTEVPAVVVELPLEREQALNIALNNAAIGSDWDPPKLTELVSSLCALPDFDATLTGFSDDELRGLAFAPVLGEAALDDEPLEERIQWILEIDPTDWDALRPALDAFISRHGLTPQVRWPRRGKVTSWH